MPVAYLKVNAHNTHHLYVPFFVGDKNAMANILAEKPYLFIHLPSQVPYFLAKWFDFLHIHYFFQS